jgi:hypothetical protein
VAIGLTNKKDGRGTQERGQLGNICLINFEETLCLILGGRCANRPLTMNIDYE